MSTLYSNCPYPSLTDLLWEQHKVSVVKDSAGNIIVECPNYFYNVEVKLMICAAIILICVPVNMEVMLRMCYCQTTKAQSRFLCHFSDGKTMSYSQIAFETDEADLSMKEHFDVAVDLT